MFTIKSCFTVPEPAACDLARPVGLLPDVRRCGEVLCFFTHTRTHAHTHTRTHTHRTEKETFVSLCCVRISGFLLSALPDKGPLQTRSSPGCHLLANMLSVIFCAVGPPSGAGPHGSPAHANRTNPSRTCLSVSLSPSLSLVSPLLPSSLHVCSTVRQPVLSPCSFIYFTLCPLISPPLSLSLSVPEDRAGAVCQLTVARQL